jgi:7-carboxy-7-deazaguanine synthase
VATIPEALGANARYTLAEADDIAQHIASRCKGPKWVLVTGGEPTDQDLRNLVDTLHAYGYKVALETSGTAVGLVGAAFDWVCVSPKIGMPGGRHVIPQVVELADEIKFVIGKPADLDKLDDLLGRCQLKPTAQICLQPVSQSPVATKFCIETVEDRGWRLSLQLHKYVGIA